MSEQQQEPTILDKIKQPKILAVIVIAALLLVGGAYFFATQGQQTETKSFKVTVLGKNGERVTGALVEVFNGDEKIAELNTVNGIIEIDDLPAELLSFKVTTPSGEVQTKIIDASKYKTLRADFSTNSLIATNDDNEFVGENEPVKILLKVIDSETKLGIAEATITYSLDKNSQTIQTNSNGNAEIMAPIGMALRLRVKASNYRTYSNTLITSTKLPAIALTPKPVEEQISFTPEEQATVVVQGKLNLIAEDSETSAPIIEGTACAYEAETGTQIACVDVSQGNAEIKSLRLGSKVHYSVQAHGYYDYSSAGYNADPIIISEQTTSTAKLLKINQQAYESGQSKYTILRTVDENGAPVQAQVNLIPYPSIIAFPTIESEGELKLQLANTTTYYAIAYAQGRVPARTDEFKPGATKTLVLETAGAANSAKLSAVVADEEGKNYSGAKVVLLRDSLLMLLPTTTKVQTFEETPTAEPENEEQIVGEEATATPEPKQAPTTPKALFYNLPLNNEYELRASYQKGVGSATTYLSEDNEVTILLEANAGFLELSAVDAVTSKPIKAEFILQQGTRKAIGCKDYECTMLAYASLEGKIVARAENYLETVRSLTYEDVRPGETTRITIALAPKYVENQGFIRFIGLTDEEGEPIESGEVTANKTYFANFFAGFNESTKNSFYARIGSTESVASDNAAILDFATPNEIDVIKSTTYRPSANCTDLEGESTSSENGEWKWVELSTSEKTINVAIPFQVRVRASKGGTVNINYRAQSEKSAQGRTTYTRIPADSELGSNQSTPTKASCYAKTSLVSFNIAAEQKDSEKPKQEEKIIPEPAAEFTVSDTITFDYENGLQSAKKLGKYALQIDSILAADAMPLKLYSKESACRILVKIESPNKQTSKCYYYDNKKQLLLFQSKQFNADCPVYIEGNKLWLDGKEFTQDENATIQFRVGGCNIEANLTMPITIKAVEAENIFTAPTGDELGEGDTVKPLYITNNLQGVTRHVSATSQPLEGSSATKEFLFSRPGVKAVAWKGPGTLTFNEGQQLLNELFYENKVPQMEPGTGTVGGNKVTQCNDYKCCARGWCGKSALKKLVKQFNDKAASLSSKTAFRRGQGEPFNYFSPNTEFTFSTPVQGIENSRAVLEQQNVSFTKETPTAGAEQSANDKCDNSTPAIYELVASGRSAETLKLSASILELNKQDLVPTDGISAKQETISLCGYLYGDKEKGITPAEESNALTTNQLQSLHYKIMLCMYPAIPVVSAVYCSVPCAISEICYNVEMASEIASKCTGPQIASNCPQIVKDQFRQQYQATAPTVLFKVNAFGIEGNVENFGDGNEKDAFVKLGNAMADAFSFSSDSDYEVFSNGNLFDFSAGSCNDFTSDFTSKLLNAGVSSAINQIPSYQQGGQQQGTGGQQGGQSVDPKQMASDFLESWLPTLGATCRCYSGNKDAFTSFQIWPPQWGGKQTGTTPKPVFCKQEKKAPVCGGLIDTFVGSKDKTSSTGSGDSGTASKESNQKASGKAGSININVHGNEVVFRVDLGVESNCNIKAPWDIDWWKTLKNPTNTLSLASYLLRLNKGDLALSLTSTPQTSTYTTKEKATVNGDDYSIERTQEETTINADGTITRTISGSTTSGTMPEGQTPTSSIQEKPTIIETTTPEGETSVQILGKSGNAYTMHNADGSTYKGLDPTTIETYNSLGSGTKIKEAYSYTWPTTEGATTEAQVITTQDGTTRVLFIQRQGDREIAHFTTDAKGYVTDFGSSGYSVKDRPIAFDLSKGIKVVQDSKGTTIQTPFTAQKPPEIRIADTETAGIETNTQDASAQGIARNDVDRATTRFGDAVAVAPTNDADLVKAKEYLQKAKELQAKGAYTMASQYAQLATLYADSAYIRSETESIQPGTPVKDDPYGNVG